MVRSASRAWFERPLSAPARRRRRRDRPDLRPRYAPAVEVLETRELLAANVGSLALFPLAFEINQGQTDAQVQYLARGPGYGLFLTPQEAALRLVSEDADSAVLRMRFVGAAPAQLSGVDALDARSNYFVGADPSAWLTDVVQFGGVRYAGLYPGIDAVFHGNPSQLQYDFFLAPGADPRQIRLAFDGAEQLSLDPAGDLVLVVGDRRLVEHAPVLYQEVDGVRQAVEGRYVLLGSNEVGFEVGDYDPTRALVIDPTLVYGSYSGGSGNDQALGVAVDAANSAYLVGLTSSANYPLVGAVQGTLAGSLDVFVTKLNAAGTARIFSTYLGGSGDDRGFGIAVDDDGYAYLTGLTNSVNFPYTAGARQTSLGGGSDAFVVKLGPTGSVSYSTYLGGSGNENNTGFSGVNNASIAVDDAGQAWVTGMTESANFPVTANARQSTHGGGTRDAFVARLNANGTALTYSTFLGGSGDDRGQAIAVDGANRAYVTGATTSDNFPVATGALQATRRGGWDVFLSKFDATQSGIASLPQSSYLGSTFDDFGQGVAVDGSGNAYLTGMVWSGGTGFPVGPGAAALAGAGHFDAFVTKVNPTGSAVVYSTFLGGSGDDRGAGIAVDDDGNAHVTGFTSSAAFPQVAALKSGYSGSFDAFVTKLTAGGTTLYYSTLLGGAGDDRGYGIALDDDGNAYVGGLTNGDTAIPALGSVQPARAGDWDALVVKIADAGNHLPYFPALDTVAVTAGQTLSFNLLARDPDAGPAPTVTVQDLPPGATYDPATGQFTWNVPGNASSRTVTFQATDASVAPTLPGGVVSRWSAEGNGADSVGTNHATLNGVAFAPGATGQAFRFDGSASSYLSVPGSGNLNSLTTALTVEAMVRPDRAGWIFARRNPLANESFGVSVTNNGSLEVAIGTTAGSYFFASAAATIHFGRFQRVVAMADTVTGVVRAYVDGRPVALSPSSGGAATISGTFAPAANLFIGRRQAPDTVEGPPLAFYYQGLIDEIKVYDHALTEPEVQALSFANTATRTVRIAVNATAPQEPTLPPTASGSALHFDGVNDAVVVASDPALHDARNLTVSGWFKVDDFPRAYQNLFFRSSDGQNYTNNGNNRVYGLWVTSWGALHFAATPVGGTAQVAVETAGGIIQPGRWYHFAAVISADQGSMRLYANGALVVQTGAFGTTGLRDPNGQPLQFSYLGHELHGTLDDVRFYHAARTQQEIVADMVVPPAAGDATLKAHWKFDEGTGNSSADAVANLSAVLGAATQAPTWVASDAPLFPANSNPTATLTVTSTADSGPGSLRQAILDANAMPGGIPVVIRFELPQSDPNFLSPETAPVDGVPGTFAIRPVTTLPAITRGLVTIDGLSQTNRPDGDTNPLGPEVVLDGQYLVAGPGLQFDGSDNVVAGLNVQRFLGHGLLLNGGDRNWVYGNYLGTDAAGAAVRGNTASGLYVTGARNVLGVDDARADAHGTPDAAERNVVSGNAEHGIVLLGNTATYGGLNGVNQLVSGQVSRLAVSATIAQADLRDASSGQHGSWHFDHPIPGGGGDSYAFRATGTLLVTAPGTYSFALSGDDGGRLRIDGIDVVVDDTYHAQQNRYGSITLSAESHTFEWVGFEGSGQAQFELSVAVGAVTGSLVEDLSRNPAWKVVGDPSPHPEIRLDDEIAVTAYYPTAVQENVVAGNYVGTNAAGNAALPNAYDGVLVYGSSGNRIGTDADGAADAAERNVISGNGNWGLDLRDGSHLNVVAGNYLGTDRDGAAAVPNYYAGVLVYNRSLRNRLGTDGNGVRDADEGNLISGNREQGVRIQAAHFTTVAGNRIGTNASGALPLGNQLEGVLMFEAAAGTTIGGAGSRGNVIAFNRDVGVETRDTATATVLGNALFDNAGLGIDQANNGVSPVLNRPVLTGARLVGDQLVVSGFARSAGASYSASTVLGVPGALAGDADTAARFGDTNNDYLVAHPYDLPANAVTVELWLKTAAGNSSGIIGYAADRGNSNEFLLYDPTNLTLYIRGQIYPSGINVADGNWHHVAASWAGDTGALRLYVDGAPRFSADGVLPNNLFLPGGALMLGQEQDDVAGLLDPLQRFVGSMDEVAVYAAALAPDRIAAHYAAGLAPAGGYRDGVLADRPANYWRLGDAPGTFRPTDLGSAPAASGRATVELYLADANPTGYGEGRTLLGTFVEGSIQDADAGVGTYSFGRAGTDTADRFTFTIPLDSLPPAVRVQVVAGAVLTATSTLGGITSEFGANLALRAATGPTAAPTITSATLSPLVNEQGVATLTVAYADLPVPAGAVATVEWGDGTSSTVELTGPSVLASAPATYNGKTYYALLTNLTWYQAEEEARRLGGHLVTINDRAENDFVRDLTLSVFGSHRQAWIGLSDAENEGVWRWASGEPVTFLNFLGAGEPNNGGGAQDHAYSNFNVAGSWDDAEGRTTTRAAIIEVGPERAFTLTHRYRDDAPGAADSRTVTVRLGTLDAPATSSVARTVTVANAAPQIAPALPGTGTEIRKTTPVANDQFGRAVAVVGNVLYVGAPLDDTGVADTGAVYAYDATTGALLRVIQKNLNPSYTRAGSDLFGFTLAAFGDRLLIGGPQDDFGVTNAGAVYVYDPAANSLTRVPNPVMAADPFAATNDQFGLALAAVGNDFLVGAPFDDVGATTDAGAAYLFDGTTLALKRIFTKPKTFAADLAGNRPGQAAGPITFGVPGALVNDADTALQFAQGQIALDIPLATAADGFTTVSFWMKTTGAGMPVGFGRYDLWLSGGSFGYNTALGDIYGIDATLVADDQWHLITAVFNNGPVTRNQIWVDGVRQTLTQRVGRLNGIALTNGGSGYTSAPSVTISNGTTSVTGQAVVTNGVVTALTFTPAAVNFTPATPPVVTISGGGGSGATAIASAQKAPVTGVAVVAGGSGYTSAPAVVFAPPPGGGIPAAGFATVANGAVTGVVLTDMGSGYDLPPTVTFVGGGGSGAVASTTVGASDARALGVVGSAAVTDGGSGYTSAPAVTFGPPLAGGVNAAGFATVVNGVVTEITITSPGAGFVSPPAITLSGGGGTGAAATAALKTPARLSGWAVDTTNRFTGALDEVAFFDRVLSESEIRAQWDARNGTTYAATLLAQAPVAYYRLGETVPTVPADADPAAPGSLITFDDRFGTSVAAGPNGTVVVSAILDDANGTNLGAVYVFDAATGALVRTLRQPTPSRTGEVQFGTAVVAVGDYLVVGSPFADNDGGDQGWAYVYEAATGRLLHSLQNPNVPAAGLGTADRYGLTLAAVGNDRVLVGAPFNDRTGADAGAAYLFDVATGRLLAALPKPTTPRSGTITNATNVNPIVITSAGHGLATGAQVVINGVGGNTAANGARTVTVINANSFSIGVAGNGAYTGGGTWVAVDQFGAAVAASADGRVLAVGAPNTDLTGGFDAGTATLYPAPPRFATATTSRSPAAVTTLTGILTDVGPDDAHTVTIDWGDRTAPSTFNVPARPVVTPSPFLSEPYSFGGATYHVIKFPALTWQQAQAQAQALGGHLVAINSTAENQFVLESIRAEIGSDTAAWIGLSDAAADGTFAWANGEPVTFSRWVAGQPANTAGVNGAATSAGNWTAYPATRTFPVAVVEIDPRRPFSATYAYPENGDYIVTVTVADDDGGTATASMPFTATSSGPIVAINGAPVSTYEALPINLSSTVTDPAGPPGAFTYAWSVARDNVPFAPGTPTNLSTFSFTPPDDGTYVVSLTATNLTDGADTTVSRTILVVNNAPAITAVSPQAVNRNGAGLYQGTFDLGSFIDVGTDGPWTVEVDWGDDSLPESFTVGSLGALGTLPHAYLEKGFYIATVYVTDRQGTTGSVGTTIIAGTIVNSTADSGPGSLRQAIEFSNASVGYRDTITFDFPNSTIIQIRPLSQLPDLVDPVTLDGYSAPNARPNNLATGSNAFHRIRIDGTLAPAGTHGLQVTGSDSVLRGLLVTGFSGTGVRVTGDRNILAGNFIGTLVANTQGGVFISGNDNLLGGVGIGDRNRVSLNAGAGVLIGGGTGNQIVNNLIGTNAAGTARQNSANALQGIAVTGGSQTLIQGNTVISSASSAAAPQSAILLGGGSHHTVQGNFIGVSAAGTANLTNLGSGIEITNSFGNLIGGAAPESRNIISANQGADGAVYIHGARGPSDPVNRVQGNYIGTSSNGTFLPSHFYQFYGINVVLQDGVEITGNVLSGNRHGVNLNQARGVRIQGNFIGTDPTGSVAVGNNAAGVTLSQAASNLVGGTTPAERNVIGGNPIGVNITGNLATGNQVRGNYLGVTANGTGALGNTYGVYVLNGADANTIGGTDPGAGNVISGNTDSGVYIEGAATTGNRVLGNVIGLGADGLPLGNQGQAGVYIYDSPDNVIGGPTAEARNVISGNAFNGISIRGTSATGNRVEGNRIGTDALGLVGRGNDVGVSLGAGAHGNVIGGAGAGNLISGNDVFGVFIQDAGTDANAIAGNRIGTRADGNSALPNLIVGVLVGGGAADTRIGTDAAGTGGAAERNVISGNTYEGVVVAGALRTVIAGNYVGTNAEGDSAVPNSLRGIMVRFGAQDTTIAGNLISGNDGDGVLVQTPEWDGTFPAGGVRTRNTTLVGNRVGTTASGTGPLGNTQSGIVVHSGALDTTIGGPVGGDGNIVAFNLVTGISVADATTAGISIRGNSLFANGGLGIDLGNNSVTANDALDADAGPNGLQNFPVLIAASTPAGTTVVAGTLHSVGSSRVDLQACKLEYSIVSPK